MGRVARTTKVKNHSKAVFIFFFLLTHVQNFLLRKIPPVGRVAKSMFSFLPQPEFSIENATGSFAVIPFNDTMTISADYFESAFKDWPGKPASKRMFLDIGANIGRYTIIASKKYGYQCVVAIEANPVTYGFLKKNIALNGIGDKAVAVQVAVGDREGTVTIQSESHHLGGGNVAHTDAGIRGSAPSSMDIHSEVKLTKVDTLFSQHNLDARQVDFIKIDVEGMEYEVLEGMSGVLAGMPKGSHIMIEISSDKPVLDVLSGHGFVSIEHKTADNLFVKK